MSAQDKEAFLSRWSRLKREERVKEEAPPAPVPEAAEDEALPPLPAVEELTHESDFTPFMNAKVPAETRRAALKKLFADPQFNVPDLNEAYSGDWTGGDPIPLEMLKTLNQAKKILFDEPDEAVKELAQETQVPDQAQVEATKEAESGGDEKQA